MQMKNGEVTLWPSTPCPRIWEDTFLTLLASKSGAPGAEKQLVVQGSERFHGQVGSLAKLAAKP